MDRFPLFPDTTQVINDSLTIAGCDLGGLAERFGTPLYIYDRFTMDHAVSAYRSLLSQYYPGEHSLTYAGKAYLCTAIAEWTQQNDLWLDCTGQAEIAIAGRAGVPREHILVHGVNKSPEDLRLAFEKAGTIVVDNLADLQRFLKMPGVDGLPDLWLRFQPGFAVDAHTYTQTGQTGSKFGMDAAGMKEAARVCQQAGRLIRGIHFHLGSQFRDPAPLVPGIQRTLDLVGEMGLADNWTLSAGGGWGVSYHEDDLPHPDLTGYLRLVAETVTQGCRERELSLPTLNLEPGRSLVGRAGVALYRVGAVKRMPGRVWALMDGGLADNPRPALYGTRYSALPVRGPRRQNQEPVWFAGPFCESGDVLIEALPFPEVQEGDLVAVPVSGAYQLSMSSNYNGARRPAVVWLEDGQAQLIQDREPLEDLFRLDHRLVKRGGKG